MSLQTAPERVCQTWYKSCVFLNWGFCCGTRKHVFLWHKKTCLLASQEDMSSCVTRKHVFLCHKMTCLLVPPQNPQFKRAQLLYHVWQTLSGVVWRPIFNKTYHFYINVWFMCFGPTEFTFLPLWGLGAVGGHQHHKYAVIHSWNYAVIHIWTLQ